MPPTPFPTTSANRGTPWLAAGLLVAMTLAVYANSLRGPFVYDDIPSIAENPTIRHFRPLRDVLLPPAAGGVSVSGRPILNLSFAINHAISGEAVWSYHLLNVLIHAGAGLALFGLLRRTLYFAGLPLVGPATAGSRLSRSPRDGMAT